MSRKSKGLRLLIGLGSAVGFLGGWVLLAHAPKPVGEVIVPRAAASAPEPGFLAPRGLQPLPSLPDGFTFPAPQLRTRGS